MRCFIAETEKGKFPREILEDAGLHVGLIGIERISTIGNMGEAYRKAGKEGNGI